MTGNPVAGVRRKTFPLRSQGLAAIATFVAAHLYYGQGEITSSLVPGALTFVLLMVQLRLIDDLDDLEQDMAAAGAEASSAAQWRRRLQIALGIAVLATVALNVVWPSALIVCLAMTALAGITPKLKPLIMRSRICLALVYESSPALALFYTYASWHAAGGDRLPAHRVAGLVGLLLVGYEFWKFSRKYGLPVFQPYALSVRGVRNALSLLLVAGPAFALLGAGDSGLLLPVLVSIVSAVFAALLAADRPETRTDAPFWGGLPLLGCLSTAVTVVTFVS